MSNLWVFGDSYTVHSDKNKDLLWPSKLAKKLDVKNFNNWSQYGVSNEYISSGFNLHSRNIQKDDYIIFIVTWKGRNWFFEDHPEMSNLNMVNSDAIVNKKYGREAKKAVKYFEQYLESERLANIKLQWYYGYLQYLETIFPNLMIIPAFNNEFHYDNNFEVKGTLFDIGFDEYKTEEIGEEIFLKKWKRFDMRAGHMSVVNHDIMCKKIYDTFTKNVPLDLDSGFEKNFINLQNYNEFETVDRTHLLDL